METWDAERIERRIRNLIVRARMVEMVANRILEKRGNEVKDKLLPGDVLTVREVAKYLHVHQSTIYRLLKGKKLPAFKIGSDWRFNIEKIDQWRFAQENPRQ